VSGFALIGKCASVSGFALIGKCASVSGFALIGKCALVSGFTLIGKCASLFATFVANPNRQRLVYPPSIGSDTPLIIEAALLSRNRIGAATSAVSAKRPKGMAASAGSRLLGSPQAICAMGVSVTVGFTLLTRIPCRPHSPHCTRVMASIAPFDA